MTTHTADDFEHAHFAMHPVTGSVASKGRMDWKWVLPGWYNTGDVSRLSDQQMADAGWAPVRMPAGSYTRTAEKVEQERDEARSRLAEAAKEIREQGETIAELAAEQPRPLTPDAITEDMVERGARQYVEEDYTSWERSPALAKNNARESVRGILEAALTEPPARPEGAEELAPVVDEMLTAYGAGDLNGTDAADFLAERGVRAVGEDGAA